MLTLQKLNAAVQQLRQKHITYAKRHRFLGAVQALSLQEFSSLNKAGRQLHINRLSGESRIRRTVNDTRLSNQLQALLIAETLGGRSGYWYCSLDHSQFGPFCIAVLAVSVRRGRAIPIWCQVNKSEAALIAPLLQALTVLLAELKQAAPQLKLVLVMDRWFASDKLFHLLSEHKAYFIARTKSDKRIQLPWDPSWYKPPIMEVSLLETEVTYRSHKLRLVRSDIKPGMKQDEPWFLLTNLPEEITRRQLLNRYAERFEIEESFKDLKWLNRLEWQRVRKPEVIRSLLLFVFLGWWLLWRYDGQHQKHQTQEPAKKKIGWFRMSWERLHRLSWPPELCFVT